MFIFDETEKSNIIPKHMLELFFRNLALKISFKHHIVVAIHKVGRITGETNYAVICEPLMDVHDLSLVNLFYSVCENVSMRFSVVDSPYHNSLGQVVVRIEQ